MKDDSHINFIQIEKKLQIEHILPQTPGADSDWKEIFTENDREKYTNSLGNLTLLSDVKNIQALNHSFNKQKEVYENKNNVTSSFVMTQRILEEHLEKPLKI